MTDFANDIFADAKATQPRELLAVPPADFKGLISDWMAGLISRGLMKEGQYYGDIYISEDDFFELLKECEKGNRKT